MNQKIMKWFTICLVFTAFSLTTCVNVTNKKTTEQTGLDVSKETRDENIIDMKAIMNDCNETFRTEMSYVVSLNSSGSFPDENDKTAKCFVWCLLEKSRVVSEDGVFDRDRAPAFFAAEHTTSTEDDFKDSTDACSDRNETCTCERSYQFVKCVMVNELDKYNMLSPA